MPHAPAQPTASSRFQWHREQQAAAQIPFCNWGWTPNILDRKYTFFPHYSHNLLLNNKPLQTRWPKGTVVSFCPWTQRIRKWRAQQGNLTLLHGWGLTSGGGLFHSHMSAARTAISGCLGPPCAPTWEAPPCGLSMWRGLRTVWWLGCTRECHTMSISGEPGKDCLWWQ